MLRVEDVSVQFDGRTVVDRVTFEVAADETLVVLGPSGSGKTTLLRAIAGLEPLLGGRISWDGHDLARVPPHERHFGLMFQEYALFPHRDVAGNVDFGLRMAGVAGEERRRRVDEVLSLVGMAGMRDRRVATLSGGEQQRVALARALAVSPRVLMFDEPLGALDRAWRERLLDQIRVLLAGARVAALYVTHDHDEAFAMATKLAVMRAGRIVQLGTPAEVWKRPADAWTAEFLGFGPVADAPVDGGVVRTPWGELAAEGVRGSNGARAVLRPGALRVDQCGHLHGEVVETTFAGDHVELTVAAAGPRVTVRVPTSRAPALGSVVRLALEDDGVLLYPRD